MKILLPFAIARKFVIDNFDLIALGWALACAQTVVPLGHFFARQDGAAWMTLAVSAAAVLRGRTIGDTAHPMLVRRRSATDAALQKAAIVLTPWMLLFLYDAAGLVPGLMLEGTAINIAQFLRSNLLPHLVANVVGTVLTALVILFCVQVGYDDGATSWHPPGSRVRDWFAGALVTISGCVLAGFMGSPQLQALFPIIAAVGPASLLGGQLLVSSMITMRMQDLAQLHTAGRRDETPYAPPVFQPLLTLVGPGIGLWLLQVMLLLFGRQFSFADAYVVAIHVVIWAGIIWPRPTPVAIQCILHEAIPTGGKDRVVAEVAEGFERPPEGALRLNPLTLKRTRSMHPWIVPVRSARIDKFDNPTRPLWARPPAPLPTHVMGDAAFEPDPSTGLDQYERISLYLRGQQDVAAMGHSNSQSKKIVILRAYPKPGESRRRRLATYKWEEGVPDVCVQQVAADTEKIWLEDGSILVISVEGYVRAYEIEIGQPLAIAAEYETFRMPQIEDYAAAGK